MVVIWLRGKKQLAHKKCLHKGCTATQNLCWVYRLTPAEASVGNMKSGDVLCGEHHKEEVLKTILALQQNVPP